MKLGQFYRAMEIAEIYDYPSHSFVIDRNEAEQFIFESVREPDEQEMQVALEIRKTPQLNDAQEIVIHNVTKKCLEKYDETEERKNTHGENER